MHKVALYARYSTDNQSVVSIEDQFRICREHAGRERWQVVGTYHDAAISSASVILRPGVQSLLQDAQRGRFDIVLAEALDRVSRDQADVATLFKHLRFAGCRFDLRNRHFTQAHIANDPEIEQRLDRAELFIARHFRIDAMKLPKARKAHEAQRDARKSRSPRAPRHSQEPLREA
jgi:hypothetical protein